MGRGDKIKEIPKQPKAKEQEEEEAWRFGQIKVCQEPGLGERNALQEDFDGLLEPGRAGEKDEVTAKSEKTSLLWETADASFWQKANTEGGEEKVLLERLGRLEHRRSQEVEICRRSQDEGGAALQRSTGCL